MVFRDKVILVLMPVSLITALWSMYQAGQDTGQIQVASGEYVCTKLANGEWWCRPAEENQ